MGWSIGYDERWKRDIGYGVPSICDHPDCDEEIDRGLAYVCSGQNPYGGEHGCGLFFCSKHRYHGLNGQCTRCANDEDPFDPKPDTEEWNKWKLTHPSWQKWRDEYPEEVLKIKKALDVPY